VKYDNTIIDKCIEILGIIGNMKQKVAIIGAGLTGLVAGYELSKKGQLVTIFDKSSEIGGLMGGFKIGETNLEKTYHHIFKSDKYILDLIKELGLQSRLKWYPEKTAIYYDKKIYPFVGAVDLLKFKPLNLIDKLRLGLVKIRLEKDNNWHKYESITADEWMKKWCGVRAYEVIWEPLLRGKFGKYYNKVSMAWMWARIHTRGNSGELGYLDGGFQQIAEELAKRIKKNGGILRLAQDADLKKIEKDFDKIIYTGASKEINYLGAICVVFTSKQSLSPFYWHNINDIKSPFVAFIQHTNLVDKKNYGNKNVYYLGKYLPNEDLEKTTEAEISQKYFAYLKKIFPKFDQKLVEQKWVFKLKNAQHIVDTKYKVPKYKIGKNVYQANFAQIYPEDRGMNYAVREGKKVTREMF
jgi:protoporphyrinogen oxidase